MSREQSTQPLNVLTLAAFLLGLAAFVFDSATSAPPRGADGAPQWHVAPAQLLPDVPHGQMAEAAGMGFDLD